MWRLTNKLRKSFASPKENPFKRLVTPLDEAGKGSFYYSLPKLNDARLGTLLPQLSHPPLQHTSPARKRHPKLQ